MTPHWTHTPAGRVTRLRGASTEVIELALTPLPADAPAVVTFRPPLAATAAEVVACALDELEAAALRLFPAWLPAAEHLEGPGRGGRARGARPGAGAGRHHPPLRTVPRRPRRAGAARAAGGSPAPGPERTPPPGGTRPGPVSSCSRRVAEPRRRPIAVRFAPEVRAAGLARVVAESYRRAGAALLVDVPDGLDPGRQRALAAAGEWLAAHGGFAVWLAGADLPAAGRVSAYPVRLPEHVAELVAAAGGAPADRARGHRAGARRR